MARARQKSRLTRQPFCSSLYARTLRCERLEDRRLLAVLTVNTDQDIVDFTDGVTSLREAIFAANIVPGADEIVFDFGHDGPATILLTQGELLISDSLTITGTGAELLTIDASGNDPTPDENNSDGKRIFLVNDGNSASLSDVRITDLTLTGADGGYPGGGAILSHENLTLSRSDVHGNAAHTGAGIYAQAGALTVANSSFTDNESRFGQGSAIFSRGSIRLVDSTLTGNQSASNYYGSAVTAYGFVELAGSTISNNVAPGPNAQAAAVEAWSGFLLVDSTVSANVNLGGIQGGGATLNRVVNSTIRDNDGLGINSATSGDGGGTHIIDSVVIGNRDSGIKIRQRGGVEVQILRSTISGNLADKTAQQSSGYDYAGGAFIDVRHGGTALIEDCVFDANTVRTSESFSLTSRQGGGGLKITLGSTSFASIIGTTISANRVITPFGSNGFGGGILLSGGNTSIADCLITGNSADGAGGGIDIGGTVLITRTAVVNNSATDQGGGIVSGGDLTISQSTISDNTSGNGGGIVAGGGGSLTIIGSSISRNHAAGSVRLPQFFPGAGGGILAAGNIQITETAIEANTAADAGGGIYSRRGLHLTNSTIANNEAGAGGGVWLIDGSIDQSTISGNRAVIGAGIYASNTEVNQSTVTLNRATSSGGGIFVDGSQLTVNHSIVARNFGTNRDITGLLGSTIVASYSLIGSNAGNGLTAAPVGSPDSNGNIIGGSGGFPDSTINPLLAPLADNGGPTLTHALLPGSPAINAGNPTAVAGVDGVPEQDQRGGPFARIVGGRIDIGAYEFQPAAGTLNGDFDGDGDVDGRDFLAWQRGYGSTGPTVTKSMGDATGNQTVNGNDLDVWEGTYGDEFSAVSDQRLASQEPRAESQGPESSSRLWTLDSLLFQERVSDDDLLFREEPVEVLSLDRAFDNWRPIERTRLEFGDIVTHRQVKRRDLATVANSK